MQEAQIINSIAIYIQTDFMRTPTFLFFIMLSFCASAQKFISAESKIHFFSDAPLEDIEATTTEARSVFDSNSGEMVFSVPVESFQFEKKLMQEHFNENYLESEKYPKSSFKAAITDWNGQTGEQEVEVSGDFTLHGVTKNVSIPGQINFTDDKVVVDAVFTVLLKDYKIKIPKAVFMNIAEEIEVTVHFEYDPYEKG